jgi:hypothetical protein
MVSKLVGPHAMTATALAKETGLACVIQSIAITETGPSRSPKPVDGDHRKRLIAIGGPANSAVIT